MITRSTHSRRLIADKGNAAGALLLLLCLSTSVTVPRGVRYATLSVCIVLALARAYNGSKTGRSQFVPAVMVLFYFINGLVTVWQSLPFTLYVLFALTYISIAFLCTGLERAEIRSLERCIVLIAILETVFATIERSLSIPPIFWGYNHYATGEEVILPNPFTSDGVPRAEGTMGHPIVLSMLLLVALLILAFDRPFRSVWITTILGSILLYGLWLSGTRSAILALVLGAMFAIASSGTQKMRLYFAYVVVWSVTLIATFDFGISRIVSNLLNSGSYTNRAQALDALPGLFDQGFFQILVGNGFGSENRLFSDGLLQQSGFRVVDNQVVTLIATTGMAGLLILACLVIRVFLRSDVAMKALIAALIVMMFSFDYLRWPSAGAIFFISLAIAWRQSQLAKESDSHPPPLPHKTIGVAASFDAGDDSDCLSTSTAMRQKGRI